MAIRPEDAITGDVIWAEFADKNGHKKLRPALLLIENPTDPNLLVCAAISTREDTPKPADHFLVPWDATGRCTTGLRKKSWIVAGWIRQVPRGEIKCVSGYVSQKLLTQVLNAVNGAC